MYLYTVNKVNLNFNLLCGQEVWSELWMGGGGGGGGGKNRASKWTNYKNYKNLVVVLVGKPFHLITNTCIYTFTCNFCSRKGGCASIGTYTGNIIEGQKV